MSVDSNDSVGAIFNRFAADVCTVRSDRVVPDDRVHTKLLQLHSKEAKENLAHVLLCNTQLPGEVCAWLLDKKRTRKCMTERNAAGYTPLQLYVINQDDTEDERCDLFSTLLDACTEKTRDLKDANGNTCMHHAATQGKYRFFALLRDDGADAHALNALAHTPTDLLVERLFADMNQRDALHQQRLLSIFSAIESLLDQCRDDDEHGGNESDSVSEDDEQMDTARRRQDKFRSAKEKRQRRRRQRNNGVAADTMADIVVDSFKGVNEDDEIVIVRGTVDDRRRRKKKLAMMPAPATALEATQSIMHLLQQLRDKSSVEDARARKRAVEHLRVQLERKMEEAQRQQQSQMEREYMQQLQTREQGTKQAIEESERTLADIQKALQEASERRQSNESALCDKQAELARINKAIERRHRDHDAAKNKLSVEISDMHGKVADLDEQRQALSMQVQQIEQQLESLQREHDESVTAFYEQFTQKRERERNQLAEELVRDRKRREEEMREQVQTQRSEAEAEMREEISALRAAAEAKHNRQLADLEEEVRQERDRFAKLQRQCDEATEKFEELQEQVTSNERRVNDVRRDKSEADEDLAEVRRAHERAERQLKEVRREIDDAEEELRSAHQRLERTRTSATAAHDTELSQKETQLVELKRHVDETRAKLKKMRAEHEQMLMRNEEEARVNNHKKQQLAEEQRKAEECLEKLAQQREESAEEFEKIRAQLEEHRTLLQERRTQLADIDERIAECTRQLEAKEEKLAQQEEEEESDAPPLPLSDSGNEGESEEKEEEEQERKKKKSKRRHHRHRRSGADNQSSPAAATEESSVLMSGSGILTTAFSDMRTMQQKRDSNATYSHEAAAAAGSMTAQQFNMNDVNQLMWETLFQACARGKHKVLQHYLETLKGSPNITNGDGDSLLDIGVRGNHSQCVELLLRQGADSERVDDYCTQPDVSKSIRDMLAKKLDYSPFYQALRRNDDQNAMRYAANVRDVNEMPRKSSAHNGYLHLTVENANQPLTMMLLWREANANKPNKRGERPLHLALRIEDEAKRENIIELLLAFGADPDLPMDTRQPSYAPPPSSDAVSGGSDSGGRRLSRLRSSGGGGGILTRSNSAVKSQNTSAYALAPSSIQKMLKEKRWRQVQIDDLVQYIQDQADLHIYLQVLRRGGYVLEPILQRMCEQYASVFDYYNVYCAERRQCSITQAAEDIRTLNAMIAELRSMADNTLTPSSPILVDIKGTVSEPSQDDATAASASSSSLNGKLSNKKSRRLMGALRKKTKKSKRNSNTSTTGSGEDASDDTLAQRRRRRASAQVKAAATTSSLARHSSTANNSDNDEQQSSGKQDSTTSISESDATAEESTTSRRNQIRYAPDRPAPPPPPPTTSEEQSGNEQQRSAKPIKEYGIEMVLAKRQMCEQFYKRVSAALNGHFEVSSYVLDHALNQFRKAERRAFFKFVRNGQLEHLVYMFNQHSLYQGITFDMHDEEHSNVHCAIEATRLGHANVLEWFIERDRRLLKRQYDQDGTTLSSCAVLNKQPLCIVLINFLRKRYYNEEMHQAEFYVLPNKHGNTVAHLCVLRTRLDLLTFVLEQVPELTRRRNNNEQTPSDLLKQEVRRWTTSHQMSAQRKQFHDACKKLLKQYEKRAGKK